MKLTPPSSQIARALITLVILGCVSACSSVAPTPSGRKGFFDRLKEDSRTDNDGYSSKNSVIGRRNRKPAELELPAGQWAWPLAEVAVTSGFGKRGRKYHEGVDLRARLGTPVFAAQEGDVIYSGKHIKGYGEMVVVRHTRGLFSIYAHHSKNLVQKGDHVSRGQQIALSGKSGHASGPHLHFEIRKGLLALDPQAILPKSGDRSYAQSDSANESDEGEDGVVLGSGSVKPAREVKSEDSAFDRRVQKLRRSRSVASSKARQTSVHSAKKATHKRKYVRASKRPKRYARAASRDAYLR